MGYINRRHVETRQRHVSFRRDIFGRNGRAKYNWGGYNWGGYNWGNINHARVETRQRHVSFRRDIFDGYFSGILETCRMARLYAGRDIIWGI